MPDINDSRRLFEQALTKVTDKPSQEVAERLIDLIRDIRDELRRVDDRQPNTPTYRRGTKALRRDDSKSRT